MKFTTLPLFTLTTAVIHGLPQSQLAPYLQALPDYCQKTFVPRTSMETMKIPAGGQRFNNKVEISPSIMTFGYDNLGGIVYGQRRCNSFVQNAAKYGGNAKRIMFVPTAYFNPTQDFLQKYDKKERLNHFIPHGYYCYDNSELTFGPTTDGNCNGAQFSQISVFEEMVTLCMEEMVKNDFEIFIAPHLDDGYTRQLQMWRNNLDFQPEANYNGMTYDQFMIQPILNAIRKTKPKKVYLSPVAEMSITLMKQAKSWVTYIDKLKAVNIPGVELKVGMTTNYKSIFGSASYRSNTFDPNVFNAQDIRTLFNTIEFFGVSAYAEQQDEYNIDPFTPAKLTENELSNVGVSLLDFRKSGREFHYTEYGVGGGGDNTCGSRPAASPKEMSEKPFSTIFYPFWRPETNPWAIQALNDYRKKFHVESWKYFSGEQSADFPVDGVFLWSLGTFDFQGISGSNDKGVNYGDAFLSMTVRCHNAKIYNIPDGQC